MWMGDEGTSTTAFMATVPVDFCGAIIEVVVGKVEEGKGGTKLMEMAFAGVLDSEWKCR